MNKKILCITKKVITGCLVAGALMMWELRLSN